MHPPVQILPKPIGHTPTLRRRGTATSRIAELQLRPTFGNIIFIQPVSVLEMESFTTTIPSCRYFLFLPVVGVISITRGSRETPGNGKIGL